MLSLEEAAELLKANEGIIALSYILNTSLGGIRMKRKTLLSPKEEETYLAIVKKRKAGLPLQYAIGRWDFYGRTFKVDRRALIPRPETELLVEEVLKQGIGGKSILEIGSGSGAISLSLALESLERGDPPQGIIATDLSRDALDLCRENQKLLDPRGKTAHLIQWIQADLFNGLDFRVDFIVSNPPYVPEKDKKNLQKELFYEPSQALFAGPDGLDFYRRLIKEAPLHLKEGGRIALEIGDEEGKSVQELLEEAGFKKIEIRKDYNRRDRMAFAEIKAKGGDLV